MASHIIATMVSRGRSAEWIQKLYCKVKDKPFTYKEIKKNSPEFKKSLLTAMHNSNVIRLLNGNKRAIGRTKKNPTVWVFTAEALILLEKYYST